MINSLAKLWAALTTPNPELQGEIRRQANLLMSMLVVLMPLALIGGSITLSLLLNAPQIEVSGTLFTIGLMVSLTFNYFLSRTRYYDLASTWFVVSPMVVIALSSLTSKGEGQYLLYYSVVSPLFASLLLSLRATWIVSIANFLMGAALAMIIPQWRIGTHDELIYTAAIGALLIVSATIRQQYLDRINTQIVELGKAEREAHTAREKAERSDQVKSAFLASMSHELRTPLNAIINFTQFVAEGDLGEVNLMQQETLGEVIKSSRHLLSLINDVLDMSKIESGSLRLFVVDDVNLNEILDQVVTTGKSLLGDKDIIIETEIAALPLLRCDRQRVLQIFLNIMSNATKFTQQGKIVVRAQHIHDEVVIGIEDSGPGIAAKDQALVFEAFKQTQTGLKQGGGSGLGMPISKNLAEAHGGRLWLESEAGHGATFFVALPVKPMNLEPITRREFAR